MTVPFAFRQHVAAGIAEVEPGWIRRRIAEKWTAFRLDAQESPRPRTILQTAADCFLALTDDGEDGLEQVDVVLAIVLGALNLEDYAYPAASDLMELQGIVQGDPLDRGTVTRWFLACKKV